MASSDARRGSRGPREPRQRTLLALSHWRARVAGLAALVCATAVGWPGAVRAHDSSVSNGVPAGRSQFLFAAGAAGRSRSPVRVAATTPLPDGWQPVLVDLDKDDRIAMAVGDTAGHVLPALAIAEAYREAWSDVDVAFLAADDGPARRLVTAAGYSLHVVPATPLVRVGVLGRIVGAMRVVPTIAVARRVLKSRDVRLVIGDQEPRLGHTVAYWPRRSSTTRPSNRWTTRVALRA